MPNYENVNAWPFREARRLLSRNSGNNGSLLFAAGFGPSGYPHIGTLGEVLRTSWVRRAFREITDETPRYIVFSDDMDGLRRTPSNLGEGTLDEFIGLPLCRIPDPEGKVSSYAEGNNLRLLNMLQDFNIDFSFIRSSDMYRLGSFDIMMKKVLANHDMIADIVKPTLGEERAATWSPFMPLHPVTGRVMAVAVTPIAGEDSIEWKDPVSGRMFRTSILGGAAKLGWKADWGMRWAALGVDYEMSGKDLIGSVELSSRICRALGGKPPVGMTVEMFLDRDGSRFSKSRGNGFSVEEWLRLGTPESLSHALFSEPSAARKIHPEQVVACTDSYMESAGKLNGTEADAEQSAWYALNGRPAANTISPVSFSMLVNVAECAGAASAEVLRGYAENYLPELKENIYPALDVLLEKAVMYAHEFRSTGNPRNASVEEIPALLELAQILRNLPDGTDADTAQQRTYEVGKNHFGKSGLKNWFACLYEVLLGKTAGPRFGHLFSALGAEIICSGIEKACGVNSEHHP